jgi:hypothetical protein
MKHERRIVLEPWPKSRVNAQPWAFIRGCIWTDGCSFVNRTGPYEYVSYDFTNYSKDIIDQFTAACDSAGITDYPSDLVLARVEGPDQSATECGPHA